MPRNRLTFFLIVLSLYFLVLPGFWGWMPVTVSADVPDEWNCSEDLPVKIVVRSWNNNFRLTTVRFFVDNSTTHLEGISEPVYPVYVLQESPVRNWNRLTLNRFTLPFARRHEVVIPFSEMKSEGRIAPGVIIGNLDIQVDHAGNVNRYSSVAFQEMSEDFSNVIPFEITLK